MTTRRRTILAVLGGIFAVLMLLVLLFPWLLLKRPLEMLASNALGREVRIGDLDGQFSLTPRITLDDLTIANAAWGSEPHMLQADRVSLVVDLRSLFGDQIEVREVQLQGPDVLLERSGEGELNWQGLGGEEDEEPSAPPSIGEVAVQDATVTYRGPQAEREVVAQIAEATGTGGRASEPMRLQGQGSLADLPLALEIETGALTKFQDSDEPFPVALAVQAGETSVSADGTVTGPLEALRLDLAVQSPEPGPLLAAFGVPHEDALPLDLRGTLLHEDTAWALTDLQARIGESTLEGRLGADPGAEPTQVQADLRAQRLRVEELQAFAQAFMPEPGPEEADEQAPLFRDGGLNPDRLPDVHAEISFDGQDVHYRGAVLQDVQLDAALVNQIPKVRAQGQGSIEQGSLAFDVEIGSDAVLRRPDQPYPIEARLQAGDNTLSVSGRLGEPIAFDTLDVRFELSSPEPGTWLALAGMDAPPLPAIAGQGRLVREQDRWRGSELSIEVGESDLAGELTLDLSGERPMLVADLRSEQLIVADFLAGTEPPESDENGEEHVPIVSAAGVNLDALPEIDADVSLQVDSFAHEEVRLEPLTLELQLRDGIPVIDATGEGSFREHQLTLEAHLGTEEALRNPDARYPVEVALVSDALEARADGTVGEPLDFTDLDVAVTLAGADLHLLGDVLQLSLPQTPAFHLESRLTHQGDDWRLADLAGTIGESDIGGEATIGLGGERVALTADLVSQRLDLSDVGVLVGAAPEGDETTTETQAEAGEAQQEDEDEEEPAAAEGEEATAEPRVIPDQPFDVPELRGMDARVSYQAEEVNAARLPLQGVSLELTLEDGRLVLDPLRFQLAGGTLASTIDLSAEDDQLDGRLDLEARRIGLNQLLSQFDLEIADIEVEREGEGTLGGYAKLAVQGNSLHRLAASADGELAVLMGGGRINALIVEALGLDAGEVLALLFGGEDGGGSETVAVQCFVGIFAVQDGVMEVQALVLETTDDRITGAGQIDLGREQLNLELVSNPSDTSVLTASTPIRIQGTFREPAVEVVTEELAQKVVAAVALGVLLPVVGAIIPFIETGDDPPGEPCRDLLQAAREAGAPAPAAGEPAEEP